MPRRKEESLTIGIDIEETLIHYAFGDRSPTDRAGPECHEHLSITVWGTVAAPKEKARKDIQASILAHDLFARPWRTIAAGKPSPPIGELQWAAQRVARVYVPPDSFWHLANGLSAGHFKRMNLRVEPPLRGKVAVASMHLLARDFELDFGSRAED